MKIYSLATKSIYDIETKNNGENLMPCPECSNDRKKKTAKSFSFNAKKGTGYCNHCEASFVEHKPFEKVEYIKPNFDSSFLDLREAWVKNALAKRSISETTLKKMRITEKTVWMPQTQKEEQVICFPYFRNESAVNIKYRGLNKSFKLESGAELCWYNYNALFNSKKIIIVEGEWDALSFIEEGFDNVISVPNGASIGKMEYFDNSISDLEKIDSFYICVDNDQKGVLLRDELVRRLGFERCYLCNLKQYKDSNEYLLGEGRNSLKNVIETAKMPKIEGVFELEDFSTDLDKLFKVGLQRGLETGYSFIDDYLTWESKRFAIITGTPGAGKSEFVDFVAINLNLRYGWKTAYFSPENFPHITHIAKIAEKVIGKSFSEKFMTYEQYYMVKEYIQENYFWVNPDENSKIDTILERFKYLIKSKGVKIVVIDPFNTVENEVNYQEQGKLLQKMVKFARLNDVLFMLVAHPKKLEKDKTTHTYPIATMYDIAGSSDFWNMADYGISIRRDVDIETKANLNSGVVSVQKVKFKHLGIQGIGYFNYNFVNGRYENQNSPWDNNAWIFREEPQLSISDNISTFESEKTDTPKTIDIKDVNF
jgi:twinkle protein